MNDGSVDVLMITHRRAEYVRRSLPRLLESAGDRTRIWLWHNGEDQETLDAVSQYSQHPAVFATHHSSVNVGIRTPTNWMWSQAKGEFISKVDDDCLVDLDWIEGIRRVHSSSTKTGVIGSWRFLEEDFCPDFAMAKVQRFDGGERVLRNHWVQGSGYLARRSLIDEVGLLRNDESFPDWCLRVARAGHLNGWCFPFVHEEHMDDPRSLYTMFTSQQRFSEYRPLHARMVGIERLEDWKLEQHREALRVQMAPIYICDYASRTGRLISKFDSVRRLTANPEGRREAWRRIRRRLRVLRGSVARK